MPSLNWCNVQLVVDMDMHEHGVAENGQYKGRAGLLQFIGPITLGLEEKRNYKGGNEFAVGKRITN